MNIDTKPLEEMLGKTWMVNTMQHRFMELQPGEAGKIVLVTDRKRIEFRCQAEVKFFVKDALPVDPSAPALPAPVVTNDVMAQLKGVLMENIERVRNDKTYIPQAQSIAKQVNTLVQLSQLELELRRVMKNENK